MPVSSSSDSETRPTQPATRAGRLARRWSTWASNLFVSGIVVLVGLTFGREVMEAWRSSSPESAGASPVGTGQRGSAAVPSISAPANSGANFGASVGLGAGSGVVGEGDELWFNNLPLAVGHGGTTGTLQEVLAKVVAACEQAAERSLADRGTWERQPGDAERRLLKQLDAATARGQRATPAGTFTVFERQRPVPLVTVVGEPIADAREPIADGANETMVERRRVLAWGMMLPDAWNDDEDKPEATPAKSGNRAKWTWFTWRPKVGEAAAKGPLSGPQVPGGRCVMRIVSADGSERWAFTGVGSPDAWRAGFERWFSERGWKPLASARSGNSPASGVWRSVGGSRWSGAFQSPDGDGIGIRDADPAISSQASQLEKPPRSTLSRRRADAHLIQEGSAALRAVLIVYPMALGE
jgi:hypothetical protein